MDVERTRSSLKFKHSCLINFSHVSIAVIDCGSLKPPTNGQIEVSTTVLGSLANYSCNPMFRLVGSETRICMENGEWIPDVPTCEREHKDLLCLQCNLMNEANNGVMTKRLFQFHILKCVSKNNYYYFWVHFLRLYIHIYIHTMSCIHDNY